MRNNLCIGSGISGMGGIPMLGTGARGLTYLIREIFRNGEQGFAYDPNDLTTLYQDAAGTIPVTTAGQPVGLMLDKSKGLVLGSELVINNEFDTPANWVLTSGIAISGGKLNITASVGGNATQTIALKQAGWYTVKLKVDSLSGSNFTVRFLSGSSTIVSNFLYKNTVGEAFWILQASAAFDGVIIQCGGGAGVTAIVDSISVKELKGNHAYQTVSASRPILQQTPILAANLLPTYDFRTWDTVGTPNPVTANSFTTASSGGVKATILKPNVKYVLELDIENTSNINIYHGANALTLFLAGTRRKVLFEATIDAGGVLYLRNTAAGTTTVYSIKVQEIIGYRTDQKYLKFDGVDDRITTTLPTQLTGCTVIRSVPNVGTQILTNQTIPTPYNDNIDNCGLIVINRALTASETSQITKLFNKAAGV